MKYKCLKINELKIGNFEIVPIRFDDRYTIMKWRNDQIYHLRQKSVLSSKEQDDYFENIVSELFILDNPNQILFSFLENSIVVGYGGLVHINWNDLNAEISFLIDTNKEDENFEIYWVAFLELIEKVAFEDIMLNKIFTYSYDIRPKLYPALVKMDFHFEARLINHIKWDKGFVDVVIYSKFKD